MAALKILFIFSNLLSISIAAASSNSPSNVFRVCSAQRFADLGLDISTFPYCDRSLSYYERARDIVSSMSLAEKVQQLGNKAQGVPRIGIPPYQWWSEALHGVAGSGPGTFFNGTVPGATSFPTVILSAASFNESLWKVIGESVSTEARAMYNLGMAGLTFWSPNINVIRDPRWGRAQETPGEDPFVTGRYAVNFVRGLQDVKGHEYSDDLNSKLLKVSSCCKHFVAYDIESWQGVDRFHFDARVTTQDKLETFQPPFEMCVKEGDVSGVMCSYNSVNGIPSCADRNLLNTVRSKWSFHGYITSDCDSVQVMHMGHKFLNDTEEDAVAQVLQAGMDLDCGDYMPNFTVSAIVKGKVREDDVDQSLINLYIVLMRLGFFDGNPMYESLGKDDVCTKDHIELAADAARQGIVLLKNDNTLPLSPSKYKNLAVVGPHANATKAMIGNYAGIPCRFVSPLDALSKDANVSYAMGCGDVHCPNDTFIRQAVEAAKNADATIIFAGLDLSVEAEGLDRMDLLLPGNQSLLINEIASTVTNPVILVIMSGSGVDISFAKFNPKINSIIWAGYPGEEGGAAIADVIFGRHNPGGRLPMTWYQADYAHKLPMTSMQMRPVEELGYPGRTYKFFNGTTVYPFGYGLSYTQFNLTLVKKHRYILCQLNPLQHCQKMKIKPGHFEPPCAAVQVDDLSSCNLEDIEFAIELKNMGERDGSYTVIVYAAPPDYAGLPSKQVVAFRRVFAQAGESMTIEFKLDPIKSLNVVTDRAYVVLPSGEHNIMIGDGDGAVKFPVDVGFYY
ncbi:hypothetical protein MRB53_032052 [Persea americana]|uniref:Uncharacterized protein n=1 Tax=Persea americana TaxID=3435 RepID=A0ACC2KR24_PERAE|nr:hypothetical protein MRB53_032052 [Persea americana]